MSKQELLFHSQSTEESKTRDFLRSVIRSLEQVYGFEILEDAFEEFRFSVEAERELEREDLSEDDF